jgi:cell division initiation protein
VKVTPLDIRRKEFKRSMRGYSDEEVDLFLDEVADESERLHQENVELLDRVRRLEEQLAGNAQLRDALEKTLVSAQLHADETKANARKESELTLRDAELKAQGIVSDSYTEVQRVQQALIQLKRLEEDFRYKFRSLLEGHLKLLDEAPINMASHAVIIEPAPPAAEETPFVVPASIDAVPEYPSAAAVAAQPETPVGPQTVTSVPAAAAASPSGPATPQPAAVEPPAIAEQPVATPEGSGDTETAERDSTFVQVDEAEAERPVDASEGSAKAARDEDPLNGFFFGGMPEGTEETLPDADKGGKSKARDFEW